MTLMNNVIAMIKRNSTTILSSTAISGVATTAYLAGRASFKAAEALRRQAAWDEYAERSFKDKADRLKHDTKLVWKFYIPAAASGIVTVTCIVGVAKVGNRRALAAQAAFVLTERAYSEYRDKVIEEHGVKKDEKIRASIAEDHVRANPPTGEVLIAGPGNVLCCELYTGRYFASDMESLRKKVNTLNEYLLRHDQSSLEEWYYMLGLAPTSFSSDLGWSSDKLLELEFTTVLTDDGRPCLAFSYNYIRPLYEGVFR
jgi:hypothetical protein